MNPEPSPVIPRNLGPQQMQALKDRLLQRLTPMLAGREVAHFDRPVHFNIGDILIDMGLRSLVEACGGRLVASNSVVDFRHTGTRQVRSSETVILLQGGGNFGDLYPHHPELWMDALRRFPHNPVILMPQSIHYEDESRLDEMAQAMQAHSRLIVFMRDRHSHDFLKERVKGVQVEMLPDTAVFLHGRFPQGCGSGSLLFRRRDRESTQATPVAAFDWRDIVGRGDRRWLSLTKKLIQLQAALNIDLKAYRLLDALHARLVTRAVTKFQTFDHIDTDRLHGMILAQVLAMKVTARDNSYGKLSRYLDTWVSVLSAAR